MVWAKLDIDVVSVAPSRAATWERGGLGRDDDNVPGPQRPLGISPFYGRASPDLDDEIRPSAPAPNSGAPVFAQGGPKRFSSQGYQQEKPHAREVAVWPRSTFWTSTRAQRIGPFKNNGRERHAGPRNRL